MTRPLKITKAVHFRSMRKGRKELREGVEDSPPTLGSVPRVSRLLALALHMDDLRRRGEVTDYAELARLAMVTRARMTQIMSLLLLAPDIQVSLLKTSSGHDDGTEPSRPYSLSWIRPREKFRY